jgi:hypothetical protein
MPRYSTQLRPIGDRFFGNESGEYRMATADPET